MLQKGVLVCRLKSRLRYCRAEYISGMGDSRLLEPGRRVVAKDKWRWVEVFQDVSQVRALA